MAISLDHICLSFPDATTLFDDLSATIPSGLIGLVGDNGTGKSTLARILAGLTAPDAGTFTGAGTVAYIPQDIAATTTSVASVMGVAEPLNALHRILNGSVDPADYDAVGTDWDIAERALAACARAGVELTEPDLDRPMNSLSGGQAMRIVLAAAIVSRADWLVLDEPTNNLDADARAQLADPLAERFAVTDATSARGAIVISHDRALLARVDAIAELAVTGSAAAGLRVYGGNWDFYRRARDAEQAAAHSHITEARKELRARRDERIAQTTRAARGNAKGAKDAANARWTPLVAGNKKRSAQVSQARVAGKAQDAEAAAKQAVTSARDAVRRDQPVHIDLPEAGVYPRAEVLDLVPDGRSPRMREGPGAVRVSGPARLRLTGPNGAGKSTLLSGIVPGAGADAGCETGDAEIRERRERLFGGLRAHAHVMVGYLGQTPELPAADSATAAVTGETGDAHRARALLAALGLRGDTADRTCAALSGGQRQRVALARVLLAHPVPRLLVLDEPTNDVDVTTTDVLAGALSDYAGALLLVTHDDDFARAVGVTQDVDIGELIPDFG